jgi:4-hydroxybenzoyl-CoA thioesterase
MMVVTSNVRIEWGDCDPAGIVYFPRYFEIFDNCTHTLFERATGMIKSMMTEKYQIVGIPMVNARANFIKPSRYGEDVSVVSTIKEFRTSSFDVYHRLLNETELAVEGFETRVWVKVDRQRPGKISARAIPPDLIALFSAQ